MYKELLKAVWQRRSDAEKLQQWPSNMLTHWMCEFCDCAVTYKDVFFSELPQLDEHRMWRLDRSDVLVAARLPGAPVCRHCSLTLTQTRRIWK